MATRRPPGLKAKALHHANGTERIDDLAETMRDEQKSCRDAQNGLNQVMGRIIKRRQTAGTKRRCRLFSYWAIGSPCQASTASLFAKPLDKNKHMPVKNMSRNVDIIVSIIVLKEPRNDRDQTRIIIRYCTQCNWLLRAGWMAQEILQTFALRCRRKSVSYPRPRPVRDHR